MIQPYDLPSWARSSSIESYGGDLDKQDLLGIGPVNPRTDLSASQIASFSSHLVSAVSVAPLAVVNVFSVYNGGTGGVSVTNFYSQFGSGLLYAPTVTATSAHNINLIFEPTYQDQYGQDQAINIKSVLATIESSVTIAVAVYSLTNSYTVKVKMVRPSTEAAPLDDLNATIVIW